MDYLKKKNLINISRGPHPARSGQRAGLRRRSNRAAPLPEPGCHSFRRRRRSRNCRRYSPAARRPRDFSRSRVARPGRAAARHPRPAARSASKTASNPIPTSRCWRRCTSGSGAITPHVRVVLAVGGGSAIDTAKALMVGTAQRALRRIDRAARRPARRSRRTRVKALIAVPTTAGTGSEVTPWATIWDRAAGQETFAASARRRGPRPRSSIRS